MQPTTIICVVGPTAAGKTGLSIELAKHFQGEIVSADSRQVYRGLDIGTAKVTATEMQGIPHHLIDVVDIDTIYTGSDFIRDADAAIRDIDARNALPIVAGGTFFYVQLLRRAIAPAPAPPNPELRESFAHHNNKTLFALLQQKDSIRAATIDPHNRRRLVRALEIIDHLGTVPPQSPPPSPYRSIMVGIDSDKDTLRNKYRTRSLDWLQAGITQEVDTLLTNGISREHLKEIGFEYELVLQLLDDELTETEYIERFIQKNWQYAKRQRTWMYKDPDITWFTPGTTPEIIEHITQKLQTNT